ncbi:hypothetical protein ID866_11844 [Astraeus odoratus]|nr:hypothetical protein ID866_11844 [Astraeus odoratus]
MPQKLGTNSLIPLQDERTKCSSPRRASACAPSGSSPPAAKMSMHIITSAQDVGLQCTELHTTLMHRELEPQTPYNANMWEMMLNEAGLLSCFTDVLRGLCQGFILNFSTIHQKQSPPNSHSLITCSKYVSKEIIKGRYLGPYPLPTIQSVLGPFQSSPLSIIPKPGCPGKFRLIQNFFFPLSPLPAYLNNSINAYTSAEDFPTTWGKFSTIYQLISHLPPGPEAATQDVAEAYWTVPLHQSQWPAAVVKLSESLGCIDMCTTFRATPAAGAYGHIADAGCKIM